MGPGRDPRAAKCAVQLSQKSSRTSLQECEAALATYLTLSAPLLWQPV